MKRLKNKKIVLGVLLIVIIFGTINIKTAHAFGLIEWITSGAIGWAVYGLNLIIGFIAGILFSISGYLVNFSLDLNSNIIGQPIVAIGWDITLSFVNLGFVLGIIVIAFATILRMESYGMKQILWKLVVAALLVNFSLVIAGAFINISNIITDFLQKKGNIGPIEAATTLAGAFEIQKLLKIGGQEGGEICYWRIQGLNLAFEALQLEGKKIAGMCSKKEEGKVEYNLNDFRKECQCETVNAEEKQKILQKASGNDLSTELLIGIASILFSVVFTLIGALTLLALAVMFLIRFIALGILLVLSPIALFCWIFPSTSNLWQKWWNEFIRWVFFGPAVTFFLYLAVQSTENLSFNNPSGLAVAETVEGSLVQHGAIAIIGNMIMLVGFMLGGLYVANSLSITGAKTFYGLAQGVGKGVGAWAGRKGKQYGTAPFRAKLWKDEEGKRTKSLGEKAVERASKMGWFGRHTFGYAARGITRLETTGGENILKEHKKAVGNMSDADLKASILTVSGPRKIAATQELQKRKLLGDVDAKNLITEENKSLFGRYRQGASWGDVEHGAKMDAKIAEELRKTGKASSESVQNFVKTYKGKDIEQSAIKDLYSGKAKLGLSRDTTSELGIAFAEAFAKENYQMVPKIIPTMNARERDNFSSVYDWVVKAEGGKAEEAWRNTMNNYAMGFSAETPTTGATPPPPTT